MKFCVSNLGPINKAEVELGDLTLICGKNNTGKTYLTYAFNTFLDTIGQNLAVPLKDPDLDKLISEGEIVVDLVDYVDAYIRIVKKTVPRFTLSLPRFLVMHPKRFGRTNIDVELTKEEILEKFSREKTARGTRTKSHIAITGSTDVLLEKTSKSSVVTIKILNRGGKLPSRQILADAISFAFASMYDVSPIVKLFPDTFIITCERTGASLFRQELVKTREIANLLDGRNGEIRRRSGNNAPKGYQRPVEKDLEFVLDLKNIISRQSFIARERPDILEEFLHIAGGGFKVDMDTDVVKYVPNSKVGGASVSPLNLNESSSTVRSLSELYFYLAHMAERGQVLMFDEPELNLHPENQRKLAHLLIRIVNAGVRVFLTTHSDYIVREINALVAISGLSVSARRDILKRFGYKKDELLDPGMIKSYVLQDGFLNSVRASRNGTFSFITFDNTLQEYMDLYKAILSSQKTFAPEEAVKE